MRKELDLDLLDKTLKSVEKHVDYADIRVNESDNTVIVMKDGKIQRYDQVQIKVYVCVF